MSPSSHPLMFMCHPPYLITAKAYYAKKVMLLHHKLISMLLKLLNLSLAQVKRLLFTTLKLKHFMKKDSVVYNKGELLNMVSSSFNKLRIFQTGNKEVILIPL